MKCDELKDYDIMDVEAYDDKRLEESESGRIQATRVYMKHEVDEAIDELKEQLRATKRALWLARAMRADDRGMRILRDSGMMFAVGKCHEWDFLNSLQKKWQRIADKCRKKAEEYK